MEESEVSSTIVKTSAGVFSFVGRVHADRSVPALVALGGSFPPKAQNHYLIDRFPEFSVLAVVFPGMPPTPWTGHPIAELTRGFEELLDCIVPDRPLILYGVSTGNLITLGARSPNIRHRVALEPFFTTETLWPFIDMARDHLKNFPGQPALIGFLREHFGITETAVENRDYRYLLEGIEDPTDVIAGAVPLLPRRALPTWPSFLGDPERAALRAHPLVTLHEGPPESGHSLGARPGIGRDKIDGLLERALAIGVQPVGG